MKRNPKKNKRDNNDAFSYETQKKNTPLTDSGSATTLCFDLGRDNTARDHVRSH